MNPSTRLCGRAKSERSSRVPSLSEPFFLHFNADCSFHIVMSPDDLKKAGLDELGKKWA